MIRKASSEKLTCIWKSTCKDSKRKNMKVGWCDRCILDKKIRIKAKLLSQRKMFVLHNSSQVYSFFSIPTTVVLNSHLNAFKIFWRRSRPHSSCSPISILHNWAKDIYSLKQLYGFLFPQCMVLISYLTFKTLQDIALLSPPV